jgi:hypothetical protein
LIDRTAAESALLEILREQLDGGMGVFNAYDVIVELKVLKARDGLSELSVRGDERAKEALKKLSVDSGSLR